MASPASPYDLARDPNLCAVCGQWCGKRCERAFTWNPRFFAYAQIVHGTDCDNALAIDRERFPGGRMTGFITWCCEMVNEWRGETKRYGGQLDHEAFDAWLKVKTLDAQIGRATNRGNG